MAVVVFPTPPFLIADRYDLSHGSDDITDPLQWKLGIQLFHVEH